MIVVVQKSCRSQHKQQQETPAAVTLQKEAAHFNVTASLI